MKINKRFILSLVAPFMIFISAIGLILRDNTRKIFYLPLGLMGISIMGLMLRENNRKIFYLPIGLMGISIILEKDLKRRLDRKNIFKKIKSYQQFK